MKKLNLSMFGLSSALGVVIYCALVAGFFVLMDKYIGTPPAFLGVTVMLALLVFSAAITGSIVFGYPAYLALNKKIKEAVYLLLYTILYLLGFILITITIIGIWS